MATNPMQRKTRNAFLLGMIITLVIAAVVVALLYMKIKSQKEEIEKYKVTTSSVYVLNQPVVSGQVLDLSMFTLNSVPTSTIPSDATADVATTLSSYSLSDTDGTNIYTGKDAQGAIYYYYFIDDNENDQPDDGEQRPVYENNGNVATALIAGSKYYYYAGKNNTEKKDITISTNSVVAKVDLKANTVITTSLITRADERTTNDLREQEYNVFTLPVELMTGDYVDIRLKLPSGQDYIVVSKKQITVPIANGSYLADTIKINLTEDEILTLSCAIVEGAKIEGATLYANKYTEAGLQKPATVTYHPTEEVTELIKEDPNVVQVSIQEINKKKDFIRKAINNAVSEYGDDDNVTKEMDESAASSLEARQKYLQSLTGTY